MPIRHVIFDLGGVVLDWNPEAILSRYVDDENERESIRRQIMYHPDWLEMDRGTLDEPTAVQQFAARTGRSPASVAAYLQHVRESLVTIPGTIALLEELTSREIPLYCLSNMPEAMGVWLRARHDFWRYFRGVVLSSEIKLVKPDPEIFHHIAREFSLTPHETVFIDDNEHNVTSAASLGFQTIRFRSPEQCRAELNQLMS